MTRQEKWMDIVNRIEELGNELNELAESAELDEESESDSIRSFPDSIDDSIFSLRVAIDDLRDQELD
jgi:hypothetical protein